MLKWLNSACTPNAAVDSNLQLSRSSTAALIFQAALTSQQWLLGHPSSVRQASGSTEIRDKATGSGVTLIKEENF
jgi:hypothetical protein